MNVRDEMEKLDLEQRKLELVQNKYYFEQQKKNEAESLRETEYQRRKDKILTLMSVVQSVNPAGNFDEDNKAKEVGQIAFHSLIKELRNF